MLKLLPHHPRLFFFSCCLAVVTSSAQREYVLAAGTANQTLSYRLRQNVTFSGCPHTRLPARQRLSVARAFALYDGHEHVLRYALAARVGSAPGELQHPPQGTSRHRGMLLSPAHSQSGSVLAVPKNSRKKGLFFFPTEALTAWKWGLWRGWHWVTQPQVPAWDAGAVVQQ